MSFPFDNSYARLPDRFHAALPPTPVADPALIAVNEALAAEIGIDLSGLDDADRAAIFSGNHLPDGATPIAQAYGGHQFGHWNPQLGDGRAILLGEVVGPEGRFDLQLKGSGPTPFSRRGDGRAWLGPVLREYLMSEAMAALGVPTTRALAAVTTGEPVLREEMLPGAVLTRVARSHIRVGTFQFFAARNDVPALEALTDHVIARHYPGAKGPEELLEAVIAAQAGLIAKWMAIGFIHGVMNTDNMSVAGETIDYGPCAFMDTYHPEMVFSSIDHMGRYAYANQPQIAAWNLAQLATSLLPLTDDKDAAIQRFTDLVHSFAPLYQAAWLREFGAKLGLAELEAPALAEELLSLMAIGQADFTNTFAQLPDARDQFLDREAFDRWQAKWRERQPDEALMAQTNPQVIPRLHRIEAAITAGRNGDLAPFLTLLRVVTRPFALSDEDQGFTAPPGREERVERTFCGT